jgi:glutamate-1-semialdehyde 2,1-aminomutase
MDTVIVVPWNDVDALESTVKRHANEVAAIITEPIMGNAGCFAPKDGFLGSLQKIARENEILTIFDEVVTGFRTALGSAQEMYGVRGDLSTFGKALGGGLPCAVYGGRAEILKEVEEMERGDQGVIGTGTFNGNSISVLGALSTMKELKRIGKKGYDQFHRRGQRLVEGIRRAAKSTGHSVVVLGFFGFFTIFFSDKESLDDYREARLHGDFGKYTRFAWQLYKRGVYVGPESWERLSMSLVHSDADVDQTIERFREAFRAL